MKNILLFTLIAILGYACNPTSEMTLSVKKPAPVSIPANIKTVAIVDRSEASNETKTLDAIHKALSLETNDLQIAGAQASLQGLSDELLKNDRFTEVKQLKNLKLYSFGSGIFPTALSWDSVAKICSETNTDALFSLELFDAASKLGYGVNPVNINAGLISIPAIQQNVAMSTNLKTGWRIYDPSSRTILDEYVLGSNIQLEGSGINPAVAASGLIGRKEAVKDAGNKAGAAYASRILPYWIRVSREYFVRGDDNFKTAQRKAQSGNWDGAAEIWKAETTSKNTTLAGRACYNMAIISEINGDLDGAIKWTQKSYEDYRINLALQYLNKLQYRKTQEDLLKTQSVTYSKLN
jgi:Family of unknown function (DUF6340)